MNKLRWLPVIFVVITALLFPFPIVSLGTWLFGLLYGPDHGAWQYWLLPVGAICVAWRKAGWLAVICGGVSLYGVYHLYIWNVSNPAHGNLDNLEVAHFWGLGCAAVAEVALGFWLWLRKTEKAS